MAKPSEKYSIVPQGLRDKFREYKQRERMEDKMEGEGMEEGSSEQDREALKKLIEDSTKGYAKGGMVKKSKGHRGDGCCIKGHTKGRMY